jgi:hypothetical protein
MGYTDATHLNEDSTLEKALLQIIGISGVLVI